MDRKQKYSGQNYAKKLNKYGQLTLSFSVFNQMQINCRTVDKEKLNPKVTLIKLLLIILQLIKQLSISLLTLEISFLKNLNKILLNFYGIQMSIKLKKNYNPKIFI